MRIIGEQDRGEIELDPVKAYHRGRQLDAALKALALPQPRGVTRAPAAVHGQRDEERMLMAARRVEDGKPHGGR